MLDSTEKQRPEGRRARPAMAGACEAVVIGASAGGVEALSILLPALPAGFPMSVLAVLHMVANRPSLLADIFRQRCALPVIEAGDKEPLLPGKIYFAPPDYHLLVERDRGCALSQDAPVNFSRPSIDVLFESAASVYRARLLGILLSGANADGSAGLMAIRQAGGDTWVQVPDSAYASAMPRSAIELGAARQVLSLQAMAARLRGWNAAPMMIA